MQNEIAITVKGKDLSEVATRMVALGQTLNGAGLQDAEPTPNKGRGKKAKAEEPEEIEEDLDETVEDESDVEDLEDDAEETEEVEEDLEESSDDEDEPAKVDAKQLATLKKALNTYSGKHGKDKAVKILHKFAKVSQDVKADDYGKLMKALKV